METRGILIETLVVESEPKRVSFDKSMHWHREGMRALLYLL